MAVGWIPKPTTGRNTVGPCAPDCHRWTLKHAPGAVISKTESHTDCADLRGQAASPCRLCAKPIGVETRMYVDPENNDALVHAACLEREARLRSAFDDCRPPLLVLTAKRSWAEVRPSLVLAGMWPQGLIVQGEGFDCSSL